MCSPPPPQPKPPPTPPGRPPPSPPPLCHEGCLPNMRGDDFCNNACNSAACDWDDGDCDATAPRLPPSPTHPPGFAPRPPPRLPPTPPANRGRMVFLKKSEPAPNVDGTLNQNPGKQQIGRVACGPGATTTLEPTFAFKRAECSGARGELLGRRSPARSRAASATPPSRETPVSPSKEALALAHVATLGGAGGCGQDGGRGDGSDGGDGCVSGGPWKLTVGGGGDGAKVGLPVQGVGRARSHHHFRVRHT
eukprot:scaffold79071_cov121-Phaeocystis_antarctica.AAC.4